MSKKKKNGYEWIEARVDCDGNLSMRYKLHNNSVVGSMSHDEDVSTWRDDEIIRLVRQLLDATNNDNLELVHA